jgi:cell division septum initiation protein DivIVA
LPAIKPDSSGLPSFQSVQRFLHLLDDINRMQDALLQETESLRARVRELEARAGGPGKDEEPEP